MKKRKVFKVISCVLMAATIAMSFAGCGDGSVSKDGTETITVWTNGGGNKAYMTEKIEKWNNTVGKEKEIKIDYTVYGADYTTIYELAFENDQAPDILAVSGEKRDFVAAKKILPITSFPGGEEYLKEMGTDIVDGINQFDGETYFLFSTSNPVGLVYNIDLFKKAGIVDENGNALPPKTWDGVREAAKKITAVSDKVYGISFPFKWASYFNWVIKNPFSASFEYLDVIDWENLTYDYSNLKQPLEWLKSIKEDGSYFPGAENLDNDSQRAQFAEGNIGMYIGASWDVGVLRDQFTATCDWDVAPLPVLDENQKFLQNVSAGHSMVISTTAAKKTPEKIMEVYKFFYSPESFKDQYALELAIPTNAEFTKDVDLSNTSKQWVSFGNLSAISRPSLPEPILKLEGDTVSDLTYKVWVGTVTDIDKAIKEINETYTKALKDGVANGSIDPKAYDMRDNYDMKRKE